MYKAKLSKFRVSARKGRLVADLIRGKKVEEAQTILKFIHKKTAEPMLKLLNSAVANAENIDGLKAVNLLISKVVVNEGPTYKRTMPRARGSADRINKRTSHIEIELQKLKEEEVKETEKVKTENKKVKATKNES